MSARKLGCGANFTLRTIKAEKGVFRKVKGAVTQAQGFRKELLGAKYCTIKFNFIKGSEYYVIINVLIMRVRISLKLNFGSKLIIRVTL